MEGAADGHVAVEGHGQQHRRFHKGESMEEKKLGKTSLKADLTNAEAEELHDSGQGGEGEPQVSEGQHGEKQVHGLVQGRLCADDSEDGGVAHDGDGVETGEGDGDPDVGGLKPRDARECEVEGAFGGVGHLGHDG